MTPEEIDYTSRMKTTRGVRVRVRSMFVPEQSSKKNHSYTFAYRVNIRNESGETVQLLRRYWEIIDGNGMKRTVLGDGVVGRQPVIEPNREHDYVSGCVLQTPFGQMSGHYVMQRVEDGEIFEVEIPAFLMALPFLSN